MEAILWAGRSRQAVFLHRSLGDGGTAFKYLTIDKFTGSSGEPDVNLVVAHAFGECLAHRALIDLVGTLVFLLPWLILVFVVAWPYVRSAWLISEASSQSDGMPGLYLFKGILLAFCVLLGLQGLATIGRSILVLTGRDASPAPGNQGPERQV